MTFSMDSRRPHGAYTLFVKEQWKNRNMNVPFIEYSREVANRWKNLDEEEKSTWHERAARERKRVQARSALVEKRLTLPIKRPRTAYIFFSMDRRQMVLREHPNSSFTEISRILGSMWTRLTAQEKGKYTKRAEADKRRYEREIKKTPIVGNTPWRDRSEKHQNIRKESEIGDQSLFWTSSSSSESDD